MNSLSNEALLDAYESARKLKLDRYFIEMLIDEIHRRGISVYL